MPQMRVYYVHEFMNDARSIASALTLAGSNRTGKTDDPDRNYMLWGGGLSTVLGYGVQLFVDYEQLSAHRFLDSWTVSGGIRMEF